jgi:hypothetical protein
MPSIKILVTQSGNDTATAKVIETGLTADGKSGWQINGLEAYWVDGNTVAANDWKLDAVLNTLGASLTTPVSDDEIARLSWGMQNTAGTAVAVPYEPSKQTFLVEPRVTVQPEIYCSLESVSTGQANDVIFVLYYEVVKLTDIEVLRLLAGGA